jgi:hypothetical protein
MGILTAQQEIARLSGSPGPVGEKLLNSRQAPADFDPLTGPGNCVTKLRQSVAAGVGAEGVVSLHWLDFAGSLAGAAENGSWPKRPCVGVTRI